MKVQAVAAAALLHLLRARMTTVIATPPAVAPLKEISSRLMGPLMVAEAVRVILPIIMPREDPLKWSSCKRINRMMDSNDE